jgi:hypothetical protein
MFSIGLRSGEFPGQSMTVNGCFLSRAMESLLVWQGAPSCKNLLTPCMAIQGNSFSLSTLMIMELFMELFMVILGGIKNREPLPFLAEKHPHTITLGECFTFVTKTPAYSGSSSTTA